MVDQTRIDQWVAGLNEAQYAQAVALFAPTCTTDERVHALGSALGDLLSALDALPPGPLTGPGLIAAATAHTRQLLNDTEDTKAQGTP